MIVIVPAAAEDAAAATALLDAAFGRRWAEAEFLRDLELAWSYVDLVKETHGGGVLALSTSWIVGGEVDLLTVATQPERRREGHACLLLRHALRRGLDHHCRRATLEVRPSNLPAVGLYESLGFSRAGVRPCYYDDGEEAWIMALALVPR